MGSIDGPYEALGCVIYCFLVKFTNEKEQMTDRRTDKPSYRDARTHLKRVLREMIGIVQEALPDMPGAPIIGISESRSSVRPY